MSVCLGTITAGELRVEYVRSLLASRNSSEGSAVIAETLLHMYGPYLDDGRNIVAEGFLDQAKSDILLFVDSDTAWTPDHVREIEAAIHPESSPVVGGLYYSGFPVVYRWGTNDAKVPTLISLTADEIAEGDDGQLVKVDAIGTGFLGIHRDLLVRMREHFGAPQPWFAEETYHGVHHGEDYTFCIRLAELGVPIYLLPKTRVTHYKIAAF